MARLAGLGLIFAASLWSAWSMLDRYFIGDDFGYVARFWALPFAEWPRLFAADWSGGLWGFELKELRPFAALTFMIDARLWGTNPLGYHVTNLLLDALCGWLVAAIVWRAYPEKPFAGIAAGVLFALHPAHAETAAWITGRVDVIATAAYLAGFWAAMNWMEAPRRRWLVLAWAAYLAGVFSKEFCLTLPVMAVAYVWIYRERFMAGRMRRLGVLFAGFVGVFAVYAVCRHVAFAGNMGNGVPVNWLRPDYLERQISYLGWIFPPVLKTVQEQRAQWLPLTGWLFPMVAVVAVSGLIVWRWRLREATAVWRAAAFFGVIWYAVATLPLVVAGYFSPRHLYFATAGFCVVLVLVIDGLVNPRWLKVALVLGLGVWSASVFSDAIRLWRASAKVSERLARAVAAEPVMATDAVWIIDAPGTYEGAWCWAWASPAALEEPFQKARPGVVVIERPEAYVATHLWRERCAAVRLETRTSAVLFSVVAKGQVERREISGTALAAAAARLKAELAQRPEMEAWGRFVQELRGAEQHP